MKASTEDLLDQFKALADPVRARLVALCRVAECSVSELTQVTGLSQPRVSQHLKQLISAGLLERARVISAAKTAAKPRITRSTDATTQRFTLFRDRSRTILDDLRYRDDNPAFGPPAPGWGFF